MDKRPRVLIVGPRHDQLLISRLIAALASSNPLMEIVSEGEGDVTIELGEGDVCIVNATKPIITDEDLKALAAASFDLRRELPPEQIGNHEGTAFYCGLKKYRRQDKRRAGKSKNS